MCAWEGKLPANPAKYFSLILLGLGGKFVWVGLTTQKVMAGAIVTLALAAFIAGIIPARRAASINPVRALRMD